jgi:uncharacterized protein YjcR
MGDHPRKADGRRVFSVEFKRTQIQRVLTGEKTLAELSRELDISPSVIRNWKRHYEAGATAAVVANEDSSRSASCGSVCAHPRARPGPGPQDDGGGDPPGGPGAGKKTSALRRGSGR